MKYGYNTWQNAAAEFYLKCKIRKIPLWSNHLSKPHIQEFAIKYLSVVAIEKNVWKVIFFITRVCFCLEIYRIVSQKQLRDPSEEEATIRPNNVETINVKPTVNSESVRKQCCNS